MAVSERRGPSRISRRSLLKKGGLLGFFGTLLGAGPSIASKVTELDANRVSDRIDSFFQRHYQQMTREEIKEALARIERKVERKTGVGITVENQPPMPGVIYGYALNISKCKGTRKCVEGCVKENNQSRDTQIQYIRVLELDHAALDLNESDHYFDPDTVPRSGKDYLPIQCMQCDNPPCVKACPTQATWKEPDGIVVVDYDWCIGCRYCMAACPYWARHFNWGEPYIPAEEINPVTHYLGNRPREKGVVEKCTFCIQRARKGRLPACLEACPTGARVFGNLLDPNSEIRYVLENKPVFRLKEELGTEPKFWYFSD
jgi:molybdopterin-containing oxidoreductase family iron-sulfur binding subunit